MSDGNGHSQEAERNGSWKGGVSSRHGEPFNVYVTKPMREAIRQACAARGGISGAEFCREALALWLAVSAGETEIEVFGDRTVLVRRPG